MKKRGLILALLAVSALLSSCKEEPGPYYPPPSPPESEEEVAGSVLSWITNGSKSKLLQMGSADILTGSETTHPFITIDFSEKLQQVEGFGAALTGSSAYLINQKLSDSQRNALHEELFDPETGIGISYLRLTIGASDFSMSDYTYNDLPSGQTDPDLEQFSIQKEKENLLPVLQSIQNIAPQLRLMGSPWSAPAWMKTSGKLAGGSLKTEWHATYANYFIKYIKAFEQEGITIDALTIQNEPLHEAGYPSMHMEAEQQADFIKNHLGPAFGREGIQTKIIAYDHNFDRPDYPLTVLNDPEANPYVAGSAFHAYGGNVSAMAQVHAVHPDKGLYFTEISGGEWATDFRDNLKWNLSNIFIGTMNNWSKTALLWNLALDENNGPKNGGCQNCRGVVTISSSGEISRNVEYYAIGQLSKFVRPGAYRVKSTAFDASTELESVAFQNEDGSKVVVILNKSEETSTFTLLFEEQKINYTLEGNAVATLVWD